VDAAGCGSGERVLSQEHVMRTATMLALSGLMALAFLLCGCEPRFAPKDNGPLTAADVVIYKEKPAKEFRDLGPVTLPTGEGMWDERGDSTRGFQLLKEKVAAMGGNGILLKIKESEYDMMVLAADKGTYYQVPMRRSPRCVIVHALSVEKYLLARPNK
jgi:hypothetical protein